jgi:hypothetical protein
MVALKARPWRSLVAGEAQIRHLHRASLRIGTPASRELLGPLGAAASDAPPATAAACLAQAWIVATAAAIGTAHTRTAGIEMRDAASA